MFRLTCSHQRANPRLVQSSLCPEIEYSYLIERMTNPGEQQRPRVRRTSGLSAWLMFLENANVIPPPGRSPKCRSCSIRGAAPSEVTSRFGVDWKRGLPSIERTL